MDIKCLNPQVRNDIKIILFLKLDLLPLVGVGKPTHYSEAWQIENAAFTPPFLYNL